MVIAQHQSISNEHFTPPLIVEAARKTMESIDLDPASCEIANEKIVKASKIFTEEINGLEQKWEGNVFLNPPGGIIKKKIKSEDLVRKTRF